MQASTIIKHLQLLRAGGLIKNSGPLRGEERVPLLETDSRGNCIKIFQLYNFRVPRSVVNLVNVTQIQTMSLLNSKLSKSSLPPFEEALAPVIHGVAHYLWGPLFCWLTPL